MNSIAPYSAATAAISNATKWFEKAATPRNVSRPIDAPTVGFTAAPRLSPGVSDAILKIFDILGKRDGAPTEAESGGDPSPELAAKIAKQDAWYTAADMSDEEFEKRVTEHLREYAKSDSALQTALDNGSVHIQRVEDVEGLNYHLNMTFQYGDYGLKQGASLKPDYSQAFLPAGNSWRVGWAGGGIGSYYITY